MSTLLRGGSFAGAEYSRLFCRKLNDDCPDDGRRDCRTRRCRNRPPCSGWRNRRRNCRHCFGRTYSRPWSAPERRRPPKAKVSVSLGICSPFVFHKSTREMNRLKSPLQGFFQVSGIRGPAAGPTIISDTLSVNSSAPLSGICNGSVILRLYLFLGLWRSSCDLTKNCPGSCYNSLHSNHRFHERPAANQMRPLLRSIAYRPDCRLLVCRLLFSLKFTF